MASGKALSFSLLFMALAVVSILPEPVYAQPNMKRGWTMNSVGYNAGLDALEKIFGGFSKRNDVMTSDEGKISMSSTQQEILQLLSEVLTLKKLQEQGVFEPALIRCLSQQSQQHDE